VAPDAKSLFCSISLRSFGLRHPLPLPLAGEVAALEERGGWGNSLHLRRSLRKHPHPALPRCSDRGQGGQVFGDIVDTSWPAVEWPDVDSCNYLGSEDSIERAVLCSWSEGDKLAAEDLGNFDVAAEQADVATLLDTAHNVARSVFEGSDGLDIAARARLIAAGRNSKFERLVRPLRVVQQRFRTPTGPFFARFFIGIILGLVAEFAFMRPSTRPIMSSFAARWTDRQQGAGWKFQHGCSTGRPALTPSL
jgi:hypothetical protein